MGRASWLVSCRTHGICLDHRGAFKSSTPKQQQLGTKRFIPISSSVQSLLLTDA